MRVSAGKKDCWVQALRDSEEARAASGEASVAAKSALQASEGGTRSTHDGEMAKPTAYTTRVCQQMQEGCQRMAEELGNDVGSIALGLTQVKGLSLVWKRVATTVEGRRW